MAESPVLSTYREGSLHASAKEIYARDGGVTEANVAGFVVDVVRDDELVEIQTGSFASAARKLRRLVVDHRIVLVYPIAVERWLLRVDADGAVLARRRSPKRGRPFDLFEELVAFPELVAHPNFRVELPMIREEEVRGPIPADARYRYPREWWRLDRRLLEIVETIRIDDPADLLALLPPGLPSPFTTADIAAASRRSKRLSMRAAYCLSKAGAIRSLGRAGRLIAYEVEPAERSAADLPAGQ
ncbi:MAG: hypothetical protein ABSB34_05620 [Candidatus Limnocylindrales bacterium]|jgi:hypothetical protein